MPEDDQKRIFEKAQLIKENQILSEEIGKYAPDNLYRVRQKAELLSEQMVNLSNGIRMSTQMITNMKEDTSKQLRNAETSDRILRHNPSHYETRQLPPL